MISVGIDPGYTGALAMIEERGGERLVTIYLSPDPTTCRNAVKALSPYRDQCHAMIEKVQAMPKMGSVGAINYGINYGFWLGLLSAFNIEYLEIRPQEWQKTILPGKPHRAPVQRGLPPKELARLHNERRGVIKAYAFQVACKLYPSMADKLVPPRCRKPHDGAVDALLIAEHCRQTWK